MKVATDRRAVARLGKRGPGASRSVKSLRMLTRGARVPESRRRGRNRIASDVHHLSVSAVTSSARCPLRTKGTLDHAADQLVWVRSFAPHSRPVARAPNMSHIDLSLQESREGHSSLDK
jgi:hypothetical protein